MTPDMFMGVARALLASAGGYAVGKGWVDDSTATTLTGAFLTLFTAGWSVYAKHQANKAK